MLRARTMITEPIKAVLNQQALEIKYAKMVVQAAKNASTRRKHIQQTRATHHEMVNHRPSLERLQGFRNCTDSECKCHTSQCFGAAWPWGLWIKIIFSRFHWKLETCLTCQAKIGCPDSNPAGTWSFFRFSAFRCIQFESAMTLQDSQPCTASSIQAPWICSAKNETIWGFPELGVPPNGWFISGKIPLKMDDDWGYPHFRKPPYLSGSTV